MLETDATRQASTKFSRVVMPHSRAEGCLELPGRDNADHGISYLIIASALTFQNRCQRNDCLLYLHLRDSTMDDETAEIELVRMFSESTPALYLSLTTCPVGTES